MEFYVLTCPNCRPPFGLTRERGNKFFELAIEGLCLYDLIPSLHVVQTLLLMALREIAQGHSSQAWVYSGNAQRLAIEMGLHHDRQSSTTKTAVSHIQEQERLRTFWGCKLISLQLKHQSR